MSLDHILVKTYIYTYISKTPYIYGNKFLWQRQMCGEDFWFGVKLLYQYISV